MAPANSRRSPYNPCVRYGKGWHPYRHDVSDHERACAVAFDLRTVQREIVQRAAPDLLLRPRGIDDDGGRRAARPSAIDQLTRDRRGTPEAHQHYDREAVRLKAA